MGKETYAKTVDGVSEDRPEVSEALPGLGERLRGVNEALRALSLEKLPGYLRAHGAELITSPRPFADYMRRKLREKGVLQQNVFLNADLSENYGYKLIAEEKRTRQRDVILRLCLAARFRLEEAQEALILYGMAPLYGRFPRDAVLLVAIQHGVYELGEVNRLLARCGQPPLVKDYEWKGGFTCSCTTFGLLFSSAPGVSGCF